MKVSKCSPAAKKAPHMSLADIKRVEGVYKVSKDYRDYSADDNLRFIVVGKSSYAVVLWYDGTTLIPLKDGWEPVMFVPAEEQIVCFELRK